MKRTKKKRRMSRRMQGQVRERKFMEGQELEKWFCSVCAEAHS